MPESTLQELLKIWVDAEEHFELGYISESVFLRTQARAIDTASRLKPLHTTYHTPIRTHNSWRSYP